MIGILLIIAATALVILPGLELETDKPEEWEKDYARNQTRKNNILESHNRS